MPLMNRGAAVGDSGTDFDAFVVRRYVALVRFGYVLTGNRASAEDLVQNALFRTYRRWQHLDAKDDPTAYVRKAMVNAHISWTRLLSSREQLFAEPPERPGGEGGDIEGLHMWRQLAALPARMRAVLVLRFYEDLSEAETARVLGCSAGTVKSQTSRGLARLRRQLSKSEPAQSQPESTPGRFPRSGGEDLMRTETSFSRRPYIAVEGS